MAASCYDINTLFYVR